MSSLEVTCKYSLSVDSEIKEWDIQITMFSLTKD